MWFFACDWTGILQQKKAGNFSFFFKWYITEKFELKSHIRDENRKFFLLIKITTLTILNVAQKSVKAWIAVNKVSVLTDQSFCSYRFALELQTFVGVQFLREDVVVKKNTYIFVYDTFCTFVMAKCVWSKDDAIVGERILLSNAWPSPT